MGPTNGCNPNPPHQQGRINFHKHGGKHPHYAYAGRQKIVENSFKLGPRNKKNTHTHTHTHTHTSQRSPTNGCNPNPPSSTRTHEFSQAWGETPSLRVRGSSKNSREFI